MEEQACGAGAGDDDAAATRAKRRLCFKIIVAVAAAAAAGGWRWCLWWVAHDWRDDVSMFVNNVKVKVRLIE